MLHEKTQSFWLLWWIGLLIDSENRFFSPTAFYLSIAKNWRRNNEKLTSFWNQTFNFECEFATHISFLKISEQLILNQFGFLAWILPVWHWFSGGFRDFFELRAWLNENENVENIRCRMFHFALCERVPDFVRMAIFKVFLGCDRDFVPEWWKKLLISRMPGTIYFFDNNDKYPPGKLVLKMAERTKALEMIIVKRKSSFDSPTLVKLNNYVQKYLKIFEKINFNDSSLAFWIFSKILIPCIRFSLWRHSPSHRETNIIYYRQKLLMSSKWIMKCEHLQSKMCFANSCHRKNRVLSVSFKFG